MALLYVTARPSAPDNVSEAILDGSRGGHYVGKVRNSHIPLQLRADVLRSHAGGRHRKGDDNVVIIVVVVAGTT